MLPVLVLVEAPEQTPVVWLEAAVKGCEAALGEGRCSSEQAPVSSAWYAQVVPDTSGHAPAASPGLRVYLYASDHASLLAQRHLAFAATDEPRQQWASVGVVIAALAAAQSAEHESAPAPAEIEPDAAPSPLLDARAAPRPALGETQAWLELGMSLSGALPDRRAQPGVAVRAGARSERFPLAAVASLGVARSAREVDLTLLTASAGLDVPLTATALPVSVELRAELLTQLVRAAATNSSGDEDFGSE